MRLLVDNATVLTMNDASEVVDPGWVEIVDGAITSISGSPLDGSGADRRIDDAFAALHRAIAINPASSTYYYLLATVCRRLGKQTESRDAMETFSRLERESNVLEEKRREALRR